MSDKELASESMMQADASEMSLLDISLVLAENLKKIISIPLLVGVFAAITSMFLPFTYTAVTRILPPQQQQSGAAAALGQLGALVGLTGAAGLKNPADQYISLLKSRTVADGLIAQFKLRELYNLQYNEDVRRKLQNMTKITAGKTDGVITIEVEERDPQRAADLANAYVEQLGKLTTTLAVTEAAQRRLFFEKRMDEAKGNLTKAEIALRSSGISESELKTSPAAAVSEVASLRARATAAEIKLSVMRTYASESNPEYRQAQQELAAFRAELNKAQQGGSQNNGSNSPEYVTRYRDFKYYETLFDLMAKQFELARIDEAREGAVIQVVDGANLPERRSSPQRTLIVLVSIVIAFFLTVIWVFIQNAVRNAQSDLDGAAKFARLRAHLRFTRQ